MRSARAQAGTGDRRVWNNVGIAEAVDPTPFADPAALPSDDPRLLEAERRRDIVRFAEALESSWSARTDAVALEIDQPTRPAGERLLGPAPSRQTLTRWTSDYIASGRALGALIPRPSTGRPPVTMHPLIADELQTQLRGSLNLGPTALQEKLQEFADKHLKEHGETLVVPTIDKVRRFKRSMPLADRLSAHYGTAAARAQTEPKLTFRTAKVNDLWFADATTLRLRIRLWDNRATDSLQHAWVEGRAAGVFVLDAHSRVVPSHWIKAAPLTQPMFPSFTAEEILATLAGGVHPELAHPTFERFAIGEPRRLRTDGSGDMEKARKILDEKLKWSIIRGKPNASWINGRIERLFRTMKNSEIAQVTGNPRVQIVFDERAPDPRASRSRNNHDVSRLERKVQEVPILSLPTLEEVRALIVWALERLANEPHQGLGNQTPLSVWRRDQPEPQSTVSQLIAQCFSEHKLKVGSIGLQIAKPVVYQSVDLHERFEIGQRVWVRADPLERGVYVYPLDTAARHRTPALFVPNRDGWVAGLDLKEFRARSHANYAKLRDKTNHAQEQLLRREIGDDAVTDLKAGQAEREAERKTTSRKERKIQRENAKRAKDAAQGTLGLNDAEGLSRVPREDHVAPGSRTTRPARGDAPSTPGTAPSEATKAPALPAGLEGAGAAPAELPPRRATAQQETTVTVGASSRPTIAAAESMSSPAKAEPPSPRTEDALISLPFARRAVRRPLFAPQLVADATPVGSLQSA